MANNETRSRQIIDDCFSPGRVPHCGLEEVAKSENERLNWQGANKRFAACAAMYEYLDEQGILKKEAFCYDVIPEREIDGKHHNKQVNFAIDSENLVKYRDQMLASGVPDAELATSYILAEGKNVVEPSHLSGATCLTWTMQTYRSNGGCVGRSWETPHEQHYYLDSQTGIGKTVDGFYEAHHDFKTGAITEDQYFDKVKEGVSEIYRQDRTVYLTKVPKSFVTETKNPDYLSVSLPCDKSKSDDGRLRLRVSPSDVMDDGYGKKIIAIGDVEESLSVSVKKNGEWKHPKENTLDLARQWRNDRTEYADNFRKTYGAEVDIKGIDSSGIKDLGTVNGRYDKPQSKVDLPNIGTIYVASDSITKNGSQADIHFYSGLDNVRVYSVNEEGQKDSKRMNARALSNIWNEQQNMRDAAKDKAIIDKVAGTATAEVSDEKNNDGLSQ